jgi:anti-anti-sigma factor
MEQKTRRDVNNRDSALSVAVEPVPGTDDAVIVRLAGFIDMFNSREFSDELTRLIKSGVTRIALDFRAISFLASAGIGAVVGGVKAIREVSGTMVLFGVIPRVMEVLQLLGFAEFLTILETEAEAVAQLQQTTVAPVFPAVASCPICGKRLRLSRSGRFRCPGCRTVVYVNQRALIELG